MASIANLLRGTDREFFDLFERAGANIVHAAELLDEMLVAISGDPGHGARTSWPASTTGDQITHDVINRLNQTSSRRSIARTSST